MKTQVSLIDIEGKSVISMYVYVATKFPIAVAVAVKTTAVVVTNTFCVYKLI